MITVSISGDASAALAARLAGSRAAVAAALDRTAEAVGRGLVDEMRRVFDRPTAFTLGAFQPVSVGFDGDGTGQFEVRFREFAGKGTPAGVYLRPQIDGGPRPDKRMETLLRAVGVLPAGLQAVPAVGAKLDANGNIDRGQLVAMLSALRAFPAVGYSANRRDDPDHKGRGRYRDYQWFAVGLGKALPPGIYLNDRRAGKARRGTSAVPVLLFVRRPRYTQRFDPRGVASRIVAAVLPLALAQSRPGPSGLPRRTQQFGPRGWGKVSGFQKA